MARYRKSQNNFNSGVLGERLYGRTDILQYANGCKKLDGFIPLRQGGVRTLPNTRHIDFGIVESTNHIPWPRTNRIPDGGYLVHTATVAGKHEWEFNNGVSGQPISLIDGLSGTDNAFKNGDVYLENIHYVQIGDVMVITFKSGGIPPHIVFNLPNGDWIASPWAHFNLLTVSGVNDFLNMPAMPAWYAYGDRAVSGITLEVGSGTLTAKEGVSATPLFSEPAEYYVGKFVKLHHVTTTSVYQVTGKISDSQLSVSAPWVGGATASPTDDWQMALFGGTDQPTTVSLFENRLVFGGASEGKAEIMTSMTGNIFFFMEQRFLQATDKANDQLGLNFYGEISDLDPYRFSITSDRYSTTKFVYGGKSLFVGTTEGVYSITGGEKILSRTSNQVSKEADVICDNVQPTAVENAFVFADEVGRVFSMQYSFDIRGYAITELTGTYQPILGIGNMVYDIYNSTLWIGQRSLSILPDAKLVGVTLVPSLNILAWHKTDVYASSFSLAPNRSLSFIGRNEAGGNFMVEYFDEVTGYEEPTPRLYLTQTQQANPIGVVQFALLADAEVTIFEYVINSGITTYTYHSKVTLDSVGRTTLEPNKYYYVGIARKATLETLSPAVPASSGDGLDALGRIDRVTLRTRNTTGGSIGTRENYMADIFALADTQPYSGVKQVSLDCGQDLENTVIIETEEPYPMEISSLVYRGQVFE